MPPIQIAAPNWCSHSTTSSGARSSSRAAACVVRVAAASSTSARPSSSGTGARSPRGRTAARRSRRRSAILIRPAMANCAASTSATRQVDGADQHRGLQRDRGGLAQQQRHGAPGGDAFACRCTTAAPGAAEARGERAGQQRQEQHAAERHRLRQDGQSVDDDRQVAEQIDQQVHASGTVTVKATSPRVMWPSIASTCQRSDVGARASAWRRCSFRRARRRRRSAACAWLWSGRVSVRRERARSMRLLYCRWMATAPGGDGAALRRLAGDQDGVRGGGSRAAARHRAMSRNAARTARRRARVRR